MKHPWFAILAAVAVLLFGGWVYIARPDHKYRLTFEVLTPQGVVSASSVMAVYLDNFSIGPIGGGVGIKGDAIFLDLGEGRNVTAILAHGRYGRDVDGMCYLAKDSFSAAGQKVLFKNVKRLTGRVPVHGSLIPTLVTFTDLNDPNTARVVDADKFDVEFGQGYRLQGVSLGVLPVGFWPFDFGGPLGKPVTRMIERSLPEIIRKLRERAHVFRIFKPDDPFFPQLGQFVRR